MKKSLIITLVDGTKIVRDFMHIIVVNKLPLNLAANSQMVEAIMRLLVTEGFWHFEDPATGINYSKFIAPSQVKQVEVIFETQLTVEA